MIGMLSNNIMMRAIRLVTACAFLVLGVTPLPSHAQAVINLPVAGTMVALSDPFKPARLQGMVINPKEPFKFDFLISRGDVPLASDKKKSAYQDLIKYFLASLAVPEQDQWVNLSPYEDNRIIEDSFGLTGMGRDLLAQDYILKQLTASLMYPDDTLGKKFWSEVYSKAQETFGTTDIPVDTFNKIWIIPDEAIILEKNNTALILKSHLKVMLEQDYKALQHNALSRLGEERATEQELDAANKISSDVVRQVILPAIEREVNEGKNFANLRQMVSGMILAAWFKKSLKESILGQVYADQRKVKGIDQDPANNQIVYQQYVEAFKKGAFNMIREDIDLYSQEVIPRKYFSGGFLSDFAQTMKVVDSAESSSINNAMATVDKAEVILKNVPDAAQNSSDPHASTFQDAVAVVLGNMGLNVSHQVVASLITERKHDDLKKLLKHSGVMNDDALIALLNVLNKKLSSLRESFAQSDYMGLAPDQIMTFLSDKDILQLAMRAYGQGEGNVFDRLYPELNGVDAGDINKVAKDIVQVLAELSWQERIQDWQGITQGNVSTNSYRSFQQEVSSILHNDQWPADVSVEAFNKDGLPVDMMKPMVNFVGKPITAREAQEYFYIYQLTGGAGQVVLVFSHDTIDYATTSAEAEKAVDSSMSLKGGIDLNSANLDMQIKRDGAGVLLPFGQQDLGNIKIDGLVPVILDISPVTGYLQ